MPLIAEAQALLAAVVESSDDAIVTKNLDGVITSWNGGAERIFGYTAEEAIGRHIGLIIPPERQDEERSILERLRRGERIDHFETIRISKRGELLDVSLTVSPVRDADGRIVGASKVARDITSRKRAEAERRESDSRFRTLADNIAQLVWMADPNGRIFWYNGRWFDYTGTTPEQMRDSGWTQVHHPEHVDRVVARIQHCWDTGEVWEDTFPLRGKDGGYRWFLSRAVPVRGEQGEVLRWFGTHTDVTEERESEEALRQADRRKDEFLATLAHEIRNPLAPLRHSIDILKQEDADPESVRQACTLMDRQLSHLERLVDDLLDVSRITRDKLELRKQRIELSELIHQVADAGATLAARSGHRLDVTVPREPVHFVADPVRLVQVLGNLLENACKYTEAGGRISLVAAHEAGDVVISVRDTGAGIPPEQLPRIFEMFAQLSPSGYRARGGLGIGLTLVQRLVEMHGGTVEAHSEGAGRGSEFVVRLPIREAGAPAAAAAAPPARARGAQRRILVVDDNADAAHALSLLLGIRGHHAHVAFDGESALEAAEALRPEVAFLDLGLPGISGHELAKRIREQPWGAGMVLVALTGWGQTEDRRRSREAGFDHHFVKPVQHEALAELLDSLAVAPDAS